MQALRSIHESRRFIRRNTWEKQLAHLQAQGHLIYSGSSHLPEIALTFDDGPDPQYTPQILEILQRYQVKATFFCIGHQVATYPHVVRQVSEAGHVIGNHTWTHPNLAFLCGSDILSQIERTSHAIQEAIGAQPLFFRPPYGSFNSQVLTQACHLGITPIIWNNSTEDWARPGTDFIIRRALDSISNGSIILMHDGGQEQSQTVEATSIIIEKLQDQGYRFITIQQLIDNLIIKDLRSRLTHSMLLSS
jgi:peptidoglycan/xylan/chitin deacetylase (PgdA/CDA1 family)